MTDLQTHVLASSSAANATVLRHGDRWLLLDAGLQYRDLQRGLGHRTTRLDGVLVTHEHQDHARSVERLLRASVDVYATSGTLQALGAAGHHRAHALTPLQRHDLPGGWRVVPIPAVHDAAEPVGYLVGIGDAKVLYLTDTAWCAYRLRRLTHVLIEANYSRPLIDASAARGDITAAVRRRTLANHLSLERAIELLQATDLSRVQQITLLHLSSGNSDAAAFQAAVQRATGRPVAVAPRDWRHA